MYIKVCLEVVWDVYHFMTGRVCNSHGYRYNHVFPSFSQEFSSRNVWQVSRLGALVINGFIFTLDGSHTLT